MDFHKRVSLVTGGNRGIGRAVAFALAKAGSDVALTYRTHVEEAQQAASEIQELGRRAEIFQLDVGEADGWRQLHSDVVNKLGAPDILINNAGEILRPATWDRLSQSDWDRTISSNLLGAFLGIRTFVPQMIDQRWGRIVNITSTYAFNGAATVLAYTTAKAGLGSMTTALAREFGKYNVTVNAVAPGNIDTEMTRSADESLLNWVISTTPVGRLGRPEEIGEAVVFLANASFVTGHVLVVDGGQLLNI